MYQFGGNRMSSEYQKKLIPLRFPCYSKILKKLDSYFHAPDLMEIITMWPRNSNGMSKLHFINPFLLSSSITDLYSQAKRSFLIHIDLIDKQSFQTFCFLGTSKNRAKTTTTKRLKSFNSHT